MKKAGLLTLTLTCSLMAMSQERSCGFDHQNDQLNLENPGRQQLIHNHLMQMHQNGPLMQERTVLMIPVVVHVIHDGGASNISYEQILSGIDMLNEDFNRLNADTIDTRNYTNAPFLPVAANVGIQFELAKLDPDGNCTNGVQRRYSPSVTNNADNNAKHYSSGGLDAWNRNNYMNIWIVDNIASDGEGVTLGYAEFPYSGGSANYGVIIRNDAYGNIGTAISGDRTLTHEIGHCLGLFHTFQGGCHSDDCTDNGDYCCDTPPESEAHWSCGSTQNSCTDVPTNDPYGFDAYDQWENFMSYAPCQNMFSEDQKALMLYNLSDITFLANLTSPANATLTGVGMPEVLCQAQFSSNTTVICAGESIQFYDESYFGVTGHAWNFSGGTPNTSTDQDPLITFTTPGIYDVSLQVTDGSSNVSTIANDYVIVLANPGEGIPYHEGFENFTISTFPDNQQFLVYNEDNHDDWEIYDQASFSGDQSLRLKNHGETGGSQDIFESGPIDLSGVDASDDLIFTFEYAYRKRNTSNDEWLQFYVSSDCGETWVLRKNLHGSQLSALVQTTSYKPLTEEEWYHVEVDNINSTFFVSGFRYKFVFTNDSGNNIFIDHINMYPASMTGITESTATDGIKVYPNPTTGTTQIVYTCIEQTPCTVYIQNALGQMVQEVYTGETMAGTYTWSVDMSALEAGIYFVNVQTNNGTQVIKLIKE